MLEKKKLIKLIEIFVLGFLFPISVVYFKLSSYILVLLWIILIYASIIYFTLYYKKHSWKSVTILGENTKYLLIILVRWIFFSLVLYGFTYYFFPDKLFIIQKNDLTLLYKIFIFYPIFSAFPQEFIFCTFFFNRYKSLFKSNKTMVLMSSLVFCFSHIFAINWVAPFLGFFGGLIFARTYSKTNSLLLVSIEHALYGNTLFFLGLGWFFWGGSVNY